jgi:P4 family phage/plasmid primase-like protien
MTRHFDIKANSIEFLKALAASAPPEEVKTAQGIYSSSKSNPGVSRKSDLGMLDVEKYLSNYGIEYDVKSESNKTIYMLNQCLFDPNHGKKEASIVQDKSGLLTYQCFHDSCNHTWHEARSMISGQDKIVQFCEGYDPNFKPQEKKSPLDTGKDSPDPPPRVPPPESVDPSVFFDGKTLRSQFLAKYLQGYLNPIIWDGSGFYRYKDTGVWKTTHTDLIGKVAEKALDKYATNSLIEASIKLMGKRIMLDEDQLRHNSEFLNLKNGMLEIATGKLHPHDAKYQSRIQMPVEYDEDAECPRWEKFLGEVFKDNLEKSVALQSYYGYCLLPDCRFQRCLFMIGSGANGKSVAADILINILGENNVCSLPLQLMGQRFLIGQLKDKLVNVATEIATNQPIDTANFKDAVAGGLLMADQKHGKPFAFYPIAKHIFNMNEIPKITDKSHGFQRRPMVLTFNQRFEPPNNDPMLLDKLKKEMNGIFMWMLQGLQVVLETGSLYVPETVEEDTRAFIQSTNPVLQWIEECCILGPDYKARPPDTYEDYKKWCSEGGNRPLARNRFYSQLMIHCPSVAKRKDGPKRRRIFIGVGLKSAW